MVRVSIIKTTTMMMMMLLLIFSSTMVTCNAEVYKVVVGGSSTNWTVIMMSQLNSSAAPIDFHVGDTLLFEYDKEHHNNVIRVTTQEEYDSCNSTGPIATWATGNDSFTITRPGHHYFISARHCRSGHKLHIRATRGYVVSTCPSPSLDKGMNWKTELIKLPIILAIVGIIIGLLLAILFIMIRCCDDPPEEE